MKYYLKFIILVYIFILYIVFDLLINNWGKDKPINELLNEKENEIIELKHQFDKLLEVYENYRKEIKESYAPRQLQLLYCYVFHSWRYVTKRRKLKLYIDYLNNQNVTLSSTINSQHHTIRETMKKNELISKTMNIKGNTTYYNNNNNNPAIRGKNTTTATSKTSFLKNNENILPQTIHKNRNKQNTLGGLKKSIGKLDFIDNNLNSSSFYEKSPMLLHTLHANPLLPNTINLDNNNNNKLTNSSFKRKSNTDNSIYIPMKLTQILNNNNNNDNDLSSSSSSSLLPPPSPLPIDNNNYIITTKQGIYTKEPNLINDNNNILPQISMINNNEDNNNTKLTDNYITSSRTSSSSGSGKRMINNMDIVENNNNSQDSPKSTPTLISEKKFSSNGNELRITTNSVAQEPLIPISDNKFRQSTNVSDSDSEFNVTIDNDDTHY